MSATELLPDLLDRHLAAHPDDKIVKRDLQIAYQPAPTTA